MGQMINKLALELKLGDFIGIGPLGGQNLEDPTKSTLTAEGAGASALANFISKFIGIMTVIAFIWFIFALFIGAIGWLTSGGDKAKVQEAQKKITTAIIGLVIVVSAIFLIKIIEVIFGISILEIQDLIINLGQTPTSAP